ncbi:putative isomerase YraM [Lysinibacillus sp. PLM2]|nr:putative isomerase YraM [Lysinibacillus sp. PLM2]
MNQTSIPCKIYRGGTSRGIFFKETDLSFYTTEQIEEIVKFTIDAQNPSQVDGLGGASSHTSKVIVVHDDVPENHHISYTFYQVGIGTNIVNTNGTCGNLMASVGLYAAEEGYVQKETKTTVKAFNKNINKTIEIEIDYSDVDYKISGIHFPTEKLTLSIMDPGGSVTGKTLPLGNTTSIEVNGETVEISFIDIINPFVFLEANTSTNSLEYLDTIRTMLSVEAGIASSISEADSILSIPKIAIVENPKDYISSKGTKISANEYDIYSTMVSMNNFHKSYAGSGLYNLAAAILLEGTIPNQIVSPNLDKEQHTIKIGHPAGISSVNVQLNTQTGEIQSVGLDRNARKIMDGEIFIPNSILEDLSK